MTKHTVLLAICLLLGGAFSVASDTQSKIRGVNLGGWLVLEQFIAPSIWNFPDNQSVIDEWTWTEVAQSNATVAQALRNHWDTWVSEEDIRNLSLAGITHLRIPIGYWIVMSQAELDYYQEPFLTGGWPYLLRSLRWAKEYNMKAIIDLHAAPGAQNPWQHSGRARQSNWGKGDTINRTLELLDRIAFRIKEFENSPELSGVVAGIGVLNEPFPLSLHGGLSTVMNFYKKAYQVVRKQLGAQYMVVIDAAFHIHEWVGFMPLSNYTNVVLDLHRYQCFDPYLQTAPLSLHWNITCRIDAHPAPLQTLPTFIGEWSVGYKVAAEWAWVEPFPSIPEQIWLKRFGMAQMRVYEDTSLGWFFWNFKTETAPMWNYLLGIKHGWFPCNLPSTEVDTACQHFNSVLCLDNCEQSVMTNQSCSAT
jgi:glucan 1,3-beta-glucosidase